MAKAVTSKLAEVFKTVFGLDRVGVIDDSMSILTLDEWDSLAHVTLIMELEKAFDITLTNWEAIEITSIGAIKKMLRDRNLE